MNDVICIILVNYNGKAYNDKCITSILNSSIGERLYVVVVDNASKDGSLEELREKWGNHSQVHIIELDDNYGFSKANNEGIKWAILQGIEYFVLLNNDTEIDKYAIAKMEEVHKKRKSIVVPKILYDNTRDIIWCAGGYFSKIIDKPILRGNGQADVGQFGKNEECTFANGCCVFLSKRIVEKIGFLDERFFLYYEDTEYSLRAKEKQEKIWYCGNALVYHKVNGSTKGNVNPNNAYYITRNWLLCNRMYMKRKFYFFCVYFVLNRFAWMAIWASQGQKEAIKEMVRGVRDYAIGKCGCKK